MELVINALRRPKGAIKLAIIIVMVITLLYMQCFIPIIEANAIAAEIVGLYALGGILAMLGIKIIPTAINSQREILIGFYKHLESKESSPLLTYIKSANNIGDLIKIPTSELPSLRGEVEEALGIDEGTLEAAVHVILKKPVTINNVDYGEISYTYEELVDGINIPYNINSNISFGNEFTNHTNNYICKNVVITPNDNTNYTISIDVYVTDGSEYSLGSRRDYVGTKDISYITLLSDNVNYCSEGKYSIIVKSVFNDLSSDTMYLSSISRGKTYYVNLNTSDSLSFKTSVGTIVSSKAGIKIIGGVSQAIEDYYDNNNSGVIPVRVPDGVVPEITEVLPVPSDYPDEVLPDLPISDDISAYDDTPVGEWDTDTDTEITDPATDVPADPDTDTGDLPKADDLKLPDLITTKFPFSIPWDLYRAFNVMVAEPQTPHWDVPVVVESANISETVSIDFEQFETLAVITRWFSVMLTALGLILATRKLIGQ